MTRSASAARASFLRTAFTFILAALAALALASPASADPEVVGPATLYSVDDVCHLSLTPETASLTTGSTHTVTATLTATPPPVMVDAAAVTPPQVYYGCFQGDISVFEGADVSFSVTSGPNAGKSGVAQLDAAGKATFSYLGTADGTDSITASIVMPDMCFTVYSETEPYSLDACDEYEYETGLKPESTEQAINCRPQAVAVNEPIIECPTITLSDTATATWTSPVVQAAADPTVSIAASKRCVSRKLTVRPSYTGGTIKSSTLFIDSRKVKSKTGAGSFVINTSKYKSGKHHIEIVTVFANGKSASKFGSFTRCAVRTAAKKVTPQFTG